jgi:uncharacterized membrane protein YjgN (DUF898 family)
MNSAAENVVVDSPTFVAPPDYVPTAVEYPFQFRGNAAEYFRIWIVNLALSIVTLGIYSAWAKVRTYRYFYANTSVADAPFEYLARPGPILRGRLIAFALFSGYVISGHFSINLQLGLLLLIALLTPWLIVRGLKFHARYSAWRSLNFRFVGDYAAAYGWYLLLNVLIPLSLGIAYPYVRAQQKRFVVESHRFGDQPFKFSATSGSFYPPYLIAFCMIIGWYLLSIAVALAVFSSGIAGRGAHAATSHSAMLFITVFLYAGLFMVFVYVNSRITNLVYNHLMLAGSSLRSELEAGELIRIYLVNSAAILCTLGMAIPWAMIRMAQYRAARLTLISAGTLDSFRAVDSADESAVGAEVGSFFDIDIGF